jgi:hypothetical protein
MASDSQELDQDIKRLRGYVVDLGELVAAKMKEGLKYKEDDHLGMMSLAFVSKQLEHLKSIIILVDGGQYRDAFGLSRIMVKGYGLLDWANRDSNRARNWRAYVWVEQFRYSYGKPANAEQKKGLEVALMVNCRQFLLPESKNKSQEEITPKDYLIKWHREEDDKSKFVKRTIEEIFKSIGLEKIHSSVYADASGWVHWNPFQIADTFQITEATITYDFIETKYLGAVAIVAAFHSLFGSSALLNDHFELGLSDSLDKIWDTYTSKA